MIRCIDCGYSFEFIWRYAGGVTVWRAFYIGAMYSYFHDGKGSCSHLQPEFINSFERGYDYDAKPPEIDINWDALIQDARNDLRRAAEVVLNRKKETSR